MNVAPEVTDITARAKAAGVGMPDVLRRAGVASTTWGRWVQGKFEPRVSTLRKIEAALGEAIAERQAA